MNKKRFTTFVLFFLFFVAGCATVPKPPKESLDLKVIGIQNGIEWDLDSVSQVIKLWRGSQEAKALVGSNVVIIGKEKITLSMPVARYQNAIMVPPDFKAKVIDRLLQLAPSALERPFLIIVDAGHGGKDPGTTGWGGTKEKDIVLDIAKKLKDGLQKKGFQVVMTRDTDVFLTLPQRTEIATRLKADLFVSIHANSSPSRSTQGFEVYSFRTLDSFGKKEDQRVHNNQIMFSELAMMKGNSAVQAVVADLLYDNKQAESVLLASYLANGTTAQSGIANRGTKVAAFFVLRNTLIPAALVEVGYLSNSREEKSLKTEAYRQKIADGLTESLYQYANR